MPITLHPSIIVRYDSFYLWDSLLRYLEVCARRSSLRIVSTN
ncbi:hypothetical protein B0G52_11637 [Cohnella sp. SGD-V74]|nr:hypothetical protein B0G52_11637 [Cohnella sp. SGD-V74]